MSQKSDSEIGHETLQRVIRVETRLMTFASKMGVDLKTEDDIEVLNDDGTVYSGTVYSEGTPVIVLKTLDVPYTSVIKAARRAGLHKKKVRVYFDGELVAEMPV